MLPASLPYSRIGFSGCEEILKETNSPRSNADLERTSDFELIVEDNSIAAMLPHDSLNDGNLDPSADKPMKKNSCPERTRWQSVPRSPGTCTRRWNQRIGLRKLHLTATTNLLTRSSRSNERDNARLPLLKDMDISSHGYLEDHPHLGPDSDKDKTTTGPNPFMRIQMQRKGDNVSEAGISGVRALMESPRMNASGKIVFQTLERSSSIPSSFHGGGRVRHVEAERRSYSANVRVTPVINIPVMSFKGSSRTGSVFGLFSSSPQKNSGKSSSNPRCRQDR